MTFQVVNYEGSVIISCATSLDLGLIQPYSKLNASIPDCGRLTLVELIIYTKKKYQHKKIESSSSVFKVPETEVNQYVTQEVQDENKQQQCPAQTDTMLQKRKCHKIKSANMRPQESRSCVTKCKKDHKQDHTIMLPHKPARKVKKPIKRYYRTRTVQMLIL